MKKQKRIPTLVGLVILIVGVAAGIFLVKKEQVFSPRANLDKSPTQIRITNVTDSSFTVSWFTKEATLGYVVWGGQKNNLDQIAKSINESGEPTKKNLHYVQIQGLSPTTNYYFKLAADTQNNLYDNQGQAYQLVTAPNLGSLPSPDTIYGTALNQDGRPAQDSIVYLTIANGQPTSTQVKSNGNWVLSLSTIRTEGSDDWVKYDLENTLLDLVIYDTAGKATNIVTTTGCARPVPTITLGKTYDFRELCGNSQPTATPIPTATPTPSATDTSNQTADNSGFDLDNPKVTPPVQKTGITIDNPSQDGEQLNTTKPQFYGSSTGTENLSTNTVITIKVESLETYTGTATLDEEGKWTWDLPKDVELEPGEHTITISYIDDEGKEQTLSRTFIVASGEDGTPAFEASSSASSATPSATPTSKPTTPTPTSTSSATTRTTMPSTESGVPASGYLTPTFILAILGIGLFALGLVLQF